MKMKSEKKEERTHLMLQKSFFMGWEALKLYYIFRGLLILGYSQNAGMHAWGT